MKKWGMASVVLLCTLMLTGCKDVEKKNETRIDATEQTSEEEDELETFVDGVVTTEDYTIEIESAEAIPTYDKKKQLVVITYSFTNTSEELLVPDQCFTGSLGVTQDLPDTVEDLMVGYIPYDSGYSDLQEKSRAKVKEGKTIKAVASYELKEKSNTVVLTAYSTTNTLAIGEETVRIK